MQFNLRNFSTVNCKAMVLAELDICVTCLSTRTMQGIKSCRIEESSIATNGVHLNEFLIGHCIKYDVTRHI